LEKVKKGKVLSIISNGMILNSQKMGGRPRNSFEVSIVNIYLQGNLQKDYLQMDLAEEIQFSLPDAGDCLPGSILQVLGGDDGESAFL